MNILLLLLTTFFLYVRGNEFTDLLNEILRKIDKKCPIMTDKECPQHVNISYWLYTRSHKNEAVKLELATLKKAPFEDGPLKVFAHGYTDNHTSPVVLKVSNGYLDHGDYNVLAVDWYDYTMNHCYYQSVQSIPTVGRCVAEFLNALLKERHFPGVHVMGHSLGAHVAAWASLYMTPTLERLTKFDPAMPLFTRKNSPKGKAALIDVYHSNCDIAGQKRPSGDVDVYFNTDTFQPGCKCDITCSHSRCVTYYLESLSNMMRAFPCPGWSEYFNEKCPVPSKGDLVQVGESIDRKARGVYMVFTGNAEPYLQNATIYTSKDLFYGFKKILRQEECFVTKYASLIKNWVMG